MDLTRNRTTLIILLYIFGMFLLPYISNTVLISLFKLDNLYLITVLANLISYVFLLIMVILLFKKDLIADFKRIPSLKHFASRVCFGEGLVYLALVISNLLLVFVFHQTDSSINQKMIEEIMVLYPVLMASTTMFFAPVIEEVIFRFSLIANSPLKPYLSLLLSSVLFGAIHVLGGGDYIQIIPYFMMGLAIGFVYQRYQNIWYPIGVHCLQNTISTLAILFLL